MTTRQIDKRSKLQGPRCLTRKFVVHILISVFITSEAVRCNGRPCFNILVTSIALTGQTWRNGESMGAAPWPRAIPQAQDSELVRGHLRPSGSPEIWRAVFSSWQAFFCRWPWTSCNSQFLFRWFFIDKSRWMAFSIISGYLKGQRENVADFDCHGLSRNWWGVPPM
jgi:hypothetical protein